MWKRYGFWGCIKLIRAVIFTRIWYPGARLIRLPFDIRNRKYIKLGKGFTTGFGCRIEALPILEDGKYCIKIGSNVQINDYVHIGAVSSVTIGDNVLMASKIYISDHNHGSYNLEFSDSPLSNPMDRKPIPKPVVIADKVWIGESCCILPGVTIGEGSIIGALSVVSKDIPPYSIAVGIPAKVIKIFNFETNNWEPVKKV
ncbi:MULTISPECIES: acetyltransferase [unclassified Pedobacter]|uniref:acetyltransferase n=1 Tax=unclassified Pedobacter TaxID=2628915 RepID=UPI001E586EC7|nr:MULTISPECIES: acetyltransferase [unclassified Pedobacter]